MIKNNSKLSEVLVYLESMIENKKTSIEKSYTNELLKKDINRISQKVGEEAVELVIAATTKNRKEVIYESADLLYHILVLWGKLEIKGENIADELLSRKK